jgi:hypothetical protein
MTTPFSTDYLIIGAGAMGLAFADTLLTDTDATMIIVDRLHAPGGHWTMAYPFVTLHQPSSFYGVASRELSRGTIDQDGLNKGMSDLATLSEIRAYFDMVMRDTLLASGRVRYFPKCEYQGDGTFTHLLSGETLNVDYDRLVDATFLTNSVPANHIPSYTWEDGVRLMPPNGLETLSEAPDGYVVIGGGKTGIDTLLHLLQSGVSPDMIRWVISRDGWMLDRAATQPRAECFKTTIGTQAAAFEAMANAKDRDDMFDRLEACGYFVRLDPDVRPQMFHAPTISRMELEALRAIKGIIRKGRVRHITVTEIQLDEGTEPCTPNTVFLDCSATAITNKSIKPVFNGDTITLQTVRAYQPTFSASMIAHVEAMGGSDADKNALTGVVPLPDSLDDFVRMQAANMMNQAIWGQNKDLRKWMRANRLDGFSELMASADMSDPEVVEIFTKLRSNAMPAAMKLQSLLNA